MTDDYRKSIPSTVAAVESRLARETAIMAVEGESLQSRAIALLREFEWVEGERERPSQNDEGEYRPCVVFVPNCPVCGGLEAEGHSLDCRLASLLIEADRC